MTKSFLKFDLAGFLATSFFLATGFFATGLITGFFATAFFTAGFLATAFFTGAFFAATFFTGAFFSGFFATTFLIGAFLASVLAGAAVFFPKENLFLAGGASSFTAVAAGFFPNLLKGLAFFVSVLLSTDRVGDFSVGFWKKKAPSSVLEVSLGWATGANPSTTATATAATTRRTILPIVFMIKQFCWWCVFEVLLYQFMKLIKNCETVFVFLSI
mmetsp:Transcript_25305/g.59236  ORF Transcript_25305/g.59236 Transcript_25305/m.59236 type:complete len:215 (-) Transcript_25305:260-904(-)